MYFFEEIDGKSFKECELSKVKGAVLRTFCALYTRLVCVSGYRFLMSYLYSTKSKHNSVQIPTLLFRV